VAGRRGVVCILALGATLSAALDGASLPRTKLDRALQLVHGGSVQVIVRAKSGRRTTVRDRLRLQAGGVVSDHALVDGVTVKLSASALSAFDSDDDVTSVSLDAPMVGTAATVAAQGKPASSLLATLGLPLDVSGRRVGVAVVDSGIDPSEDIGPRAFFDFTAAAGVHPYDDYGHGTHVSGLIASRGLLSQTAAGARYPGVAPKASLISLKVLDANGVAFTSTVLEAIEFAVVNRRALGIDVLNISLGHPILEPAASDPLVQAVEAACRAGIVVVVAAGNVGRTLDAGLPGYAGILSPGNARSAITVGAVDTQDTASRRDDAVASYSSRGPTWYDARAKPDLVAPGNNLVSDAAAGSTLALTRRDLLVTPNGSQAQFLRLSGTSQATAVASGVVALVIEAMRDAGVPVTPALVKTILSYTAIPLRGYDGLTQGHGEVNAAGAIALARALAGVRLPAPLTVIAGDAWTWSQHSRFARALVHGNGTDLPPWAQTIVWGTSHDGDTIVWGTNARHDGDTIVGDTIVWGTTSDGDTIVWGTTTDGDTIVWGTGSDGDTIVWGTTVDGHTTVWGTASERSGPAPPFPLLRGRR
jgi:serine protease AprX